MVLSQWDLHELSKDMRRKKWNAIILNLHVSKRLRRQTSAALSKVFDKTPYVTDGTSPCDLLLQLGNTGYVKHDSKVNGGFQPVLVQLLFQWLLQVNPSLLVLLVEVPQAEVCYLTGKQRICKHYGWTKPSESWHTYKNICILRNGGIGLYDIWKQKSIFVGIKKSVSLSYYSDRTSTPFQSISYRTTWFCKQP